MNKTLLLLLFGVSGFALEMELKPAEDHSTRLDLKTDLELNVFGLSYHSNRDYEYNEVNQGFGLSLAFSSQEERPAWHPSIVLSGGMYNDSYSETATYLMAGPRFTLGYDDSFHVAAGAQAGYLNGSGSKGFGVFPFVTIGYDWLNLGITGDPLTESETVQVGNKRVASTKMVAVFLNLRVLTF